MKRLFLTMVLAAMFLSPSLWAGQWDLQNSTAESDTAILSLAAPTESKVVGFGVEPDGQGGSRSVWFKSADGLQWSKEQAGGNELLMLSHLACPSATRCWAVGISINMQTMAFKNVIMGSVTGGDAWFIPVPTLTHAVGWISPRDETNLWLVAGAAVIPIVDNKVKTAFVPKIEGEPFNGILDATFVGQDTVFVVNGESEQDDQGNDIGILPRGALLRSDDGGSTWTALFRDRMEKPTRVRFFSDKVGFMMGETPQGAFLRRTEDGGLTWIEVLLPIPAAVPTPTFLGDWALFHANAGLILASDKDEHDQSYHVVYRMKDGKTLQEEPLPANDKALFTMTCPSQKACWIAGENHVIWKFTGTDEDVVPEGPVTGNDVGGMPDVAVPEGIVSDVPAGDQATSGDGTAGSDGGESSGGSSCSVGEPGAGAVPVLLMIALLGWLGRRTPRDA